MRPSPGRFPGVSRRSARILYAEITSLCNKKGYCWASNSYFAGLYDVDRSTITKWIKALNERGYITIEYVYAEHTPNIQQRKIYLAQSLPAFAENKHEAEGGGEILRGGGEIFHQGGGEKSPERILKTKKVLLLIRRGRKKPKRQQQPKFPS